MATEASVKKRRTEEEIPPTLTKAEYLAGEIERKENKKWNFFNDLLKEHDALAQAVIDALHEEGLAGKSIADNRVLSPRK